MTAVANRSKRATLLGYRLAAKIENQLMHSDCRKGADVVGDVYRLAGEGSPRSVRRWNADIVERRLIRDRQRRKIPPFCFTHPNYLIVAGEIAILPLAFDALGIAVGFSACNALLRASCIGFEQALLGLSSYKAPSA
ncbi:MAG TPA: hypothetical protein VNE82_11875 [Candidatus Binataceae bacterium]|nr:hypothetical protein [Candidatus Binataceae bacterium]